MIYLPINLGSFSEFPNELLFKFKVKSEPINSLEFKSTYPFINFNELFSTSDKFIFLALKIFFSKSKLRLESSNLLFKLS